jgi:long-subunit acyl-CoA synthetase (AMP-forming)
MYVCVYECRCPEASFTLQPGSEMYLLFLPMYHIYAQMIVQISMYQGDTLTVMAKFRLQTVPERYTEIQGQFNNRSLNNVTL